MALKRELVSLFIAAIAISVSGNIIGPFLPLYLQSLKAPVIVVGLLISLINLAQALVKILGGVIADRFDEKPILMFTLILAMVPPTALLVANQWMQTVPWLIIYGVAMSLFTPVWNVTIARNTAPNSSRARVFGAMNMAWPIGIILGPIIGGVLAEAFGWSGIMYSLLAVYSIGLVSIVIVTRHGSHFQTIVSRRGQLKVKPFATFILFQCLVAFGYGCINPILPLYITSVLESKKEFVGVFWSICYGVTFLSTQIPGGRLAEKIPLRRVLLLGVTAAPMLLVSMPSVKDRIIFFLLNVALDTLWHLSVPAGNVIFLKILPDEGRGFYIGLGETIIMLAWTVAPSLSTFLYDVYGAGAPFYTSALFFALATVTAGLQP
ncbi:MAG: MFS transporter [Candidatus Bathyarchaeia archaeon]